MRPGDRVIQPRDLQERDLPESALLLQPEHFATLDEVEVLIANQVHVAHLALHDA